MKWFVKLYYHWQDKYSLDFEACLDTPVYIYNLQSRHTLKEHINEFIKNNQGKILTKEELELLCWEIDCLRESDKHLNNLGKEKAYFRLAKTWPHPSKKYIPGRSLILSSHIYAYDRNQRKDWTKRNADEQVTKTTEGIKNNYKILANFPSDKTLIKEIIKKILSYNATKPVVNNYRFTLYINLYYTFCHESKKYNSSRGIGDSMD